MFISSQYNNYYFDSINDNIILIILTSDYAYFYKFTKILENAIINYKKVEWVLCGEVKIWQLTKI